MTTPVMITQAVMTTPRPKLTPNLIVLTSITYGLTYNMPILDDKLICTPIMTTLVLTTLATIMTTLRPIKIDPGFDIPEFNYLCYDM